MKILHDNTERNAAIRKCVDAIAIPVGCTLGPNGRLVIINHYIRDKEGNLEDNAYPTKDGVTVAREIEPTTPEERAIFSIFKQVAMRANTVAGDGTTTATVIARELIHLGLTAIENGAKPDPLIREMKAALGHVKTHLETIRRTEIDDATMRAVATISMNGDAKSANVVVDAFDAVGIDGQLTPEQWRGDGLSLEIKRGYTVGHLGWHDSPAFLPPEANAIGLQDCDILLIDTGRETFNAMPVLTDILNKYGKRGNPLLILFSQVTDQILAGIASNRDRGFDITALRMRGTSDYISEIMRDIATVTDAKIVGNGNTPFKDAARDPDFVIGKCDTIYVHELVTNFAGGRGTKEATVARANALTERAELADNEQIIEDLKARSSMLGKGAAVLKIGGKTPSERRELWDRVVDAISAVRAANKGGIVVGGGFALVRCAMRDIGDTAGAKIVREAIIAPCKSMYESSGHIVGAVYAENGGTTQEQGVLAFHSPLSGFDFRTGTRIEDMFAAGIVDPYHVVITALDAAESIATILLNTGAILCE